MIRDIKNSLVLSGNGLPRSENFSVGGTLSFAAFMDQEMDALGEAPSKPSSTPESAGDSEGINSYTGFFAEIQKRQMEELRKEILEEMGLTEEKLAQMEPEARARVETIIAKQIQKRMMAQSAMEEEGQSVKKRMLLESIDTFSL